MCHLTWGTIFSFQIDLPSDVDHYHELVPLETHTLNNAVKSNTYGLITSTYKASNSRTGMRYCLKRIHGNCIVYIIQLKNGSL